MRVLVDQRGAKQTSPETWRRLRAAGCDFRVYHRARFHEFALYNHRDHRKIAVIDGRIAYTFGHGIAAPPATVTLTAVKTAHITNLRDGVK